MEKIKDIRKELLKKYKNKDFVIDRTGVKTIEILGSTFIADEDYIIREASKEYIQRELQWYESGSLKVNDIPGNVPLIWNNIASKDGEINSNYGWAIFSEENFYQYNNVLNELKNNPNSRRATMIYNRPSMHIDYKRNGMNDFICTYANQFFIRNNKLHSHYIMRSNDAVFGFNNDIAWARYVQEKLASDLKVNCGDIIWTASSLHVYERHFHLLDELLNK